MNSKGRAPRRSARSLRGVVCACGAVGIWVCASSLGAAQNGDGPASHAVVEGDTLWDLSRQYYGSSYEWPRMWSLNPEITNPHWIYPGHILRLREGAPGGLVAQGAAITAPASKSALRPGLVRGGKQRLPMGTVLLGEEIYLDAEALERAATIVGSSEDHLMMSPSDEVYLKFDKGTIPKPGQELTVFVRLHRDEVKAQAGQLRTYRSEGGEVVRVLGALKVEAYDDKGRMARAVITEAFDPIERGFEVTDIPRRLAQVTPKANRVSVRSEIVAAPRPLGTLGQNQVVFIGAGAQQGVEVGNRFSVVRQGDPWREDLSLREELTGAERPLKRPPKGDDYPEEVVGEARVVFVRPESCTALITSSLTELAPGDRVEMREGY